MINKGLFTSNKSDWETPNSFFDKLNEEFHFVWDLAASEENAKCQNFYSIEDDSLIQNWHLIDGWCFVNPPYTRDLKKWVEKCYIESLKGAKIVALLPARPDTRYFHKYIYEKPNVEFRFVKGRLKFSGAKNSAPFPSMVVVFRRTN